MFISPLRKSNSKTNRLIHCMHSIAGHWIREASRSESQGWTCPGAQGDLMQSVTHNLLSTAAASHHEYLQSHLSFLSLESTSSCYKWVGEVLIPVRMWSLQLKSIWKSGLVTGSFCPLTVLLLLPLQLLVLFPVLWVFNNSALTPQKFLPERQNFDCQAMMWATGRWAPGQPGAAWWNRTDISTNQCHSHENIFPLLLWAAALSQPPSPLLGIPGASLALLPLLSVHN